MTSSGDRMLRYLAWSAAWRTLRRVRRGRRRAAAPRRRPLPPVPPGPGARGRRLGRALGRWWHRPL